MKPRSKTVAAGLIAVAMFGAGAVLLRPDVSMSLRASPGSGSSFLEVPVAGTSDLEATIASLEAAPNASPEERAALAGAYLQKGRVTADPAYYGLAARALHMALKEQPDNLSALLGRGQLSLARHDFPGALRWGRAALGVDPVNPTALGVLGDALFELGRYRAGVRAYQEMMDIRPDLASWARVSYAREMHGDVSGAIGAMKNALRASGGSSESAAWVGNQLGDLYFSAGRLTAAAQAYRYSLDAAAGFTPPLAGLAQVNATRGHRERAIALYRRAVARLPLPQTVAAFGDVLTAFGDDAAARTQYGLVRAQNRLLRSGGVMPDVEITLFLADHGREQRALGLARSQFDERPSVRVADALAWSLYRNGMSGKAARVSRLALRLGTRDALFHFHAGMIAMAAGDDDRARSMLREALSINPHFSIRYARVARGTLHRLEDGQ